MSTHDYIIADASGSAFLADLNLAVKALAENNSSATEPAVMYAHMWWADTTNDILKKRNATNTGWISYLTLSTGAPLVTSGTWAGNAVTATTATTATSVNTLNSGMVTIASHATTADIFAAAANTIDWTGTATTTAFPAAPKAGMTRTLYCADACAFTAGANLLVEGFASGATVTMAAGAIVNVIALTTTQFKITYSASGTFTATGTGFASVATCAAKFSVINGCVSLHIDGGLGAVGVSSNATTFTITGLPACIVPSVNRFIPIGEGYDNGAHVYVVIAVSSGAILDLANGHKAGAWTASGFKDIETHDFSWLL